MIHIDLALAIITGFIILVAGGCIGFLVAGWLGNSHEKYRR